MHLVHYLKVVNESNKYYSLSVCKINLSLKHKDLKSLYSSFIIKLPTVLTGFPPNVIFEIIVMV